MGADALIPLVARHLGSYLDLGAAAAAEMRSALVRRLALILAAVLTGIVGLTALWVSGLIAVWNSEWRTPYAVSSGAVLVLLTIVLVWRALSSTPGPSSGTLRSEMRKDMELFQQWKSTL